MKLKLTHDMKRVIKEQRQAYVATVCPDGTRHLSTNETIAIWGDDQLVFAEIGSLKTALNLRKNPAIEINVMDSFVSRGYQFKGSGDVVVDGKCFQEIMRFYRGRWADTAKSKAEARIGAFVLVRIDTVSPPTSPAYDDTADEQSILQQWISHFVKLNESNVQPALLTSTRKINGG